MPPYALSYKAARARRGGVRGEEKRALVYASVVGSLQHRLEKTEAPNLLRAENEDCAVSGDPKTRAHQGPMSNWPTSEAAELRGARTEPL